MTVHALEPKAEVLQRPLVPVVTVVLLVMLLDRNICEVHVDVVESREVHFREEQSNGGGRSQLDALSSYRAGNLATSCKIAPAPRNSLLYLVTQNRANPSR